ncbi:MAG: PEP-CTERM sorting domain-containing protein [Pseudomonadota bacterium]
MLKKLLLSAAVASVALSAAHASNVTPDVIFGSGNANGSFTIAQDATTGVELGLRAKLRFDANGQPQNQFNYDGIKTYTFDAGAAVGGFSAITPVWNFEWSINADFDDNGGSLADYTYLLEVDGDPNGVDFGLTYDPVNPFGAGFSCTDNALGTNTTGNGGGTSVNCASLTGVMDYTNALQANNVAQNSVNYDFLDGILPQLANFDPNDTGIYTIRLSAFSGMNLIAQTEIDVEIESNPVPVPGAAALMAAGLAGMAGRRRQKKA